MRRFVIILILLYYVYYLSPLNGIYLFRFIPTIVMIGILLLGIVSVFKLKKWSTLDGVVFAYGVMAGLNAILLRTGELNVFMTILRATYWCSAYFIARIYLCFSVISVKYDKILSCISAVLIFSFILNNTLYSRADELIGNNAIYFPLLILPWMSRISLLNRKWLILVILMFCTIISLKRSATIIMVFSLVIIYCADFLFRRKKTVASVLIAILLFILWVALGTSDTQVISDLSSRFSAEELEDGNGRTGIYEDVLMRFSYGTSMQKIIGRGYNMARFESPIDKSAHNDFLEVIYDYGYIGLFIYIALYLILIGRSRCLMRMKSELRVSYLVSIVCFVVLSMVSHLVIYPTYFASLVAFWAYAENQMQLSEKVNEF